MEKKQILSWSREILSKFLNQEFFDPKLPRHSIWQEKRGLFVTLKKDHQLRGCLGIVEPHRPLWQELPDQVINTATKDPRFPPLQAEELNQTQIEISLLSPIKPVSHFDNFILGIHGAMIKSGEQAGIFLPQVATENNWDKETFLSHLCQEKALLGENCWKNPLTEKFIFTVQSFGEEKLF